MLWGSHSPLETCKRPPPFDSEFVEFGTWPNEPVAWIDVNADLGKSQSFWPEKEESLMKCLTIFNTKKFIFFITTNKENPIF